MKNVQNFLSENFPFLIVNFSMYLNRHVFKMDYLLETSTQTVWVLVWWQGLAVTTCRRWGKGDIRSTVSGLLFTCSVFHFIEELFCPSSPFFWEANDSEGLMCH